MLKDLKRVGATKLEDKQFQKYRALDLFQSFIRVIASKVLILKQCVSTDRY